MSSRSIASSSAPISKRRSRNSAPKKSVRFDTLEIIEFPCILGDNPSCSSGAPLTLDWKPQEQCTVKVDFYEFTRDPRRSRLTMKKSEREEHLLAMGCTPAQLAQVEEQIAQIKKDRESSATTKSDTWAAIKMAAKRVVKSKSALAA